MPHTNHFWTFEEKQLLLQIVAQCGKNWDTIRNKYFPQLTLSQLSSQYYKALRESNNGVLTRKQQTPTLHFIAFDALENMSASPPSQSTNPVT